MLIGSPASKSTLHLGFKKSIYIFKRKMSSEYTVGNLFNYFKKLSVLILILEEEKFTFFTKRIRARRHKSNSSIQSPPRSSAYYFLKWIPSYGFGAVFFFFFFALLLHCLHLNNNLFFHSCTIQKQEWHCFIKAFKFPNEHECPSGCRKVSQNMCRRQSAIIQCLAKKNIEF